MWCSHTTVGTVGNSSRFKVARQTHSHIWEMRSPAIRKIKELGKDKDKDKRANIDKDTEKNRTKRKPK